MSNEQMTVKKQAADEAHAKKEAEEAERKRIRDEKAAQRNKVPY
jgi:hypothetical protein